MRVDDGVVSVFRGDNTLACRDAFLDWWASTPSPRFAMVNFGSAHEPFHFPDPDLLPPRYPPCIAPCSNRARYEAVIVGVDTAMGQILSVVGRDAYVFFLGDNGTPGLAPPKPHSQTVATRPDQDPARVKLEKRWKLLVREDGVEELYDLRNDPREQVPLLPTGPEYARLALKRAGILAGGD